MSNVIIDGLFSNTFSCSLKYKKDIHDFDSFIDILVYHLSETFGNKFTFYITHTDLIVTSHKFFWIYKLVRCFSNLQIDLREFLDGPVTITTAEKPDPVYWEIKIKHGAIEKKEKISY